MTQVPGEAASPESMAQVRDRAVHATPVSCTISDPTLPDNPLVWVNPGFTAETGYLFDEAVGRNCRFLQGADTDQRVVAAVRESLQSFRPITTTLLNYRKDGTPFWNEVSISPVVDRSGAVTHFVGVQADVTGRVDAQRARDAALERAETASDRLALLADFATRLTTSLDPGAIAHLLADMLVPRLGSWCTLHLKDGDGVTHPLVQHERLGFDAQVKELVDRLEQAIAEGLPTDTPSRRVMRGELPAMLIADVDADPIAAGLRDNDVSGIARQLGIASLVVVPLAVRDRILGCVTVVADGKRPPFESADLALIQELCSRAALMLENSRRYEYERAANASLQRSLMPRVPDLPGYTVAAEYLTAADEAAVGGDWYDVFALRDGAVGVGVGDAMGHNFDSAAAMGKLSTMLRAYAWPGASASEVLTATDRLIVGTGSNYLATCFYGVLRSTASGADLEHASAGHPAPILRLRDGSTRVLDSGHGDMLGISSLVPRGPRPRVSARTALPAGSTLIVFTDGLTDSMGDGLDVSAAVERLEMIVAAQEVGASPQQLVSALVASAGGGRKDDAAIIAVRVD